MRGFEETPQLPAKLGEFLAALLRRKRRLKIYVLNWDFAMIYALEREWMPTAQAGWNDHRRLSYRWTASIRSARPTIKRSSSSTIRWHSSAGWISRNRDGIPAPTQPRILRRVDADGQAYPPFHDVQMMVAGQAASALGDLFRRRWQDL